MVVSNYWKMTGGMIYHLILLCGSLHLRTIQGFQKLFSKKQTFGTLGWFEEYYQQPELDNMELLYFDTIDFVIFTETRVVKYIII